MAAYICLVCGWEYDEDKGYSAGDIKKGTKWKDVPAGFKCPLCGVGKDQFAKK